MLVATLDLLFISFSILFLLCVNTQIIIWPGQTNWNEDQFILTLKMDETRPLYCCRTGENFIYPFHFIVEYTFRKHHFHRILFVQLFSYRNVCATEIVQCCGADTIMPPGGLQTIYQRSLVMTVWKHKRLLNHTHLQLRKLCNMSLDQTLYDEYTT